MTHEDFIIDLFRRVDDMKKNVPPYCETMLWPNGVVTMGFMNERPSVGVQHKIRAGTAGPPSPASATAKGFVRFPTKPYKHARVCLPIDIRKITIQSYGIDLIIFFSMVRGLLG